MSNGDYRQVGMRPMIDRVKGCRHCQTASGLKKMRDTISRLKNRIQDMWTGRKKGL